MYLKCVETLLCLYFFGNSSSWWRQILQKGSAETCIYLSFLGGRPSEHPCWICVICNLCVFVWPEPLNAPLELSSDTSITSLPAAAQPGKCSLLLLRLPDTTQQRAVSNRPTDLRVCVAAKKALKKPSVKKALTGGNKGILCLIKKKKQTSPFVVLKVDGKGWLPNSFSNVRLKKETKTCRGYVCRIKYTGKTPVVLQTARWTLASWLTAATISGGGGLTCRRALSSSWWPRWKSDKQDRI